MERDERSAEQPRFRCHSTRLRSVHFQHAHKRSVHVRPHPGNVLFRTGEDGYEFALVDINRMTFDCNSWKELSKNFRALLDTEDATATVAAYYAAILKKNDIELPAADFESYARKIYSAHQHKLISRRRFKNMFSRKKK